MIFNKLQSLLVGCTSISLLISANKDKTLSVVVIPKAKEGADSALSTPLHLTATAEELDAGFLDVLEGYSEKHLSLAQQLENATTILDAAKAESQKKTSEAISKSSTGKVPKKVTPDADENDTDDSEDELESGSNDVTETGQDTPSSETKPSGDSLWGED